MTPVINGNTHYFQAGGVYDGVSLMRDRETGSYWNHVTGACLHGPLEGTKLPVFNLLHMSTPQVLALYPDIEVAISDRPIRGQGWRYWPLAERIPGLPDRFRRTMAGEDTRRPTMDVGLGVWAGERGRYYPMEEVSAHDNWIIDGFERRKLLVYFGPSARALSALYTDAASATWEGEDLRLSTGEFVRRGALYDADGERLEIGRPLQVFTRWYGFALMFPETEIYEP